MSKIELLETNSGYNLQKINSNFQKIEEEFNDKVLYRDNPNGEPNEMLDDLDMNGNRIYNLPTPAADHEAARLKDVQDAVAGAAQANMVEFAPYGDITANNVQGAIQQVRDVAVSSPELAAEGPDGGASLIGGVQQTVDSIAELRALKQSSASKYASVTGYYSPNDGGGGLYYLDSSDTTSPDDGGSIIVASDGGRWKLVDTKYLSVKQFGAIGDGVVDDFVAFDNWSKATVRTGAQWIIDKGNYLIDGPSPIYLRTSGVARGEILVPKSNGTFSIIFERDEPGEVVSTATWGSLERTSHVMLATNAIGKNVWMNSTQVLADRLNVTEPYYYRREFIRVRTKQGNATTPLVCTYSDKSKLVATAYTPSTPISITGLSVRIIGDGPDSNIFPRWKIERDNVLVLGGSLVNDSPSTGFRHGPLVDRCADVTFYEYKLNGANTTGPGYGVQLADTIGVSFIRCEIVDCEHAITGRHNTDVLVSGGRYGNDIDDHWGNRWRIGDGAIITPIFGGTAISYAGYDIEVDDITVSGGNLVLGVRTDTPYLGGNVKINNVKIFSQNLASFYWVFGYTSPNGVSTAGRTFAVAPFLPDNLDISNIHAVVNEPIYIVYLGEVLGTPNISAKRVSISGDISANRKIDLFFMLKNALWQTESTHVFINTPVDCNGGDYISIWPGTGHTGNSHKVRFEVNGGRFGGISWAHNLVDTGKVTSSGITSIRRTTPATNFPGPFTIQDCHLVGGSFDATMYNIAIMSSVFTGNYSGIDSGLVTMIGNVALSGLSGIPVDIRTNIVAPYY